MGDGREGGERKRKGKWGEGKGWEPPRICVLPTPMCQSSAQVCTWMPSRIAFLSPWPWGQVLANTLSDLRLFCSWIGLPVIRFKQKGGYFALFLTCVLFIGMQESKLTAYGVGCLISSCEGVSRGTEKGHALSLAPIFLCPCSQFGVCCHVV
jgi:hypothetical protein